MTGSEMVRLYRSRGWRIDRIRGSHYVLKKGSEVCVIPVHAGKDLSKGLEAYLRKCLDR